MRFRKLRIAWSVFCGIACVLLCVLWVRSHPWFDQLQLPMPYTHGIKLNSLHGDLSISVLWKDHETVVEKWATDHRKMHPDQVLGNAIDGPVQVLLNDRGTFEILAPHWSFVLFGVILAAVAWVPWPKGFSLRTLLIATTLVAVVLGLIVAMLRWPAG